MPTRYSSLHSWRIRFSFSHINTETTVVSPPTPAQYHNTSRHSYSSFVPLFTFKLKSKQENERIETTGSHIGEGLLNLEILKRFQSFVSWIFKLAFREGMVALTWSILLYKQPVHALRRLMKMIIHYVQSTPLYCYKRETRIFHVHQTDRGLFGIHQEWLRHECRPRSLLTA
jgi:hypothetical protein